MSLSKWIEYHVDNLTQTNADTIKEILKLESLFDAENLNGFSEHLLNTMHSYKVVKSLLEFLAPDKKDEIESRLRSHVKCLTASLEPLCNDKEISWKECEVDIYNAISEISFSCMILNEKSRFSRTSPEILQ